MVTPFDEVSVDKCIEFGVDILKVASSDIRDRTLLEKMASTGLPVIASSGGADLDHLDRLVAFFASRDIPFALKMVKHGKAPIPALKDPASPSA